MLAERVLMSYAMHNLKRAQGFTLVELLVVIAIISLLVSITIPVISSAMERGRAAACMGRMKAIHGAEMAYASDHDQYIAPSFRPPGVVNWWEHLAPYLGDIEPWRQTRWSPGYEGRAHYAKNFLLGGEGHPAYPQRTFYLVRDNVVMYGQDSWNYGSDGQNLMQIYNGQFMSPVHMGGVHILRINGAIEWHSTEWEGTFWNTGIPEEEFRP